MAATDWLSQGTLVLASNNKGKIAEFEKMFAELKLPVEVIPQGKLHIEDAIEDGLSFVENAIIKARHASRISDKPAIADDSGICVPVLGGAPGIYSARYAGEHGDDAANNEKLLADLKPLRNDGEPIEGMFVCVLALVQHAEDPLPQIFQGIWKGEILEAARGENGFGYDPLFWLPELGIASAEMSKEEKIELVTVVRQCSYLKRVWKSKFHLSWLPLPLGEGWGKGFKMHLILSRGKGLF